MSTLPESTLRSACVATQQQLSGVTVSLLDPNEFVVKACKDVTESVRSLAIVRVPELMQAGMKVLFCDTCTSSALPRLAACHP